MKSRTVIEGTLRMADLIPAFLRELEALDSDAARAYTSTPTGFAPIPAYALEDAGSEWWDSESAQHIAWDLEEALSERAPLGYVFGAHPDDGACFGFWPWPLEAWEVDE